VPKPVSDMSDPSHELPRLTSINPHDPEDVRLWALALGATPATIQAAVVQVGTNALAVQAHLIGQGARRG
jgi:hypothetical protein